MKNWITLLAITMLLISCQSKSPDIEMKEQSVDMELSTREIEKIYEQVLIDRYGKSKGQIFLIYEYAGLDFAPSTSFFEDTAWVYTNPAALPELEKSTWENFLLMNTQPIKFEENLDIGVEYLVITGRQFGEVYNQPGFFGQVIATAYPNSLGVEYFSRIGVNEAQNQALVYIEYYCGVECAGGDLYLLAKNNYHWEIINHTETFRS